MDAIDRAFAEYKTAVNGFEAATRRMRDAKEALLRALDMWPSDGVASGAAPTPRPLPRSAPSGKPWSSAEAKATIFALGDNYGAVVGKIVGAGGSVSIGAVPSCVDGQVLAVSGVAAACAAMRSKARKAGARADFIGEREGRVVLDAGFVAAYRAWTEPHREERSLRSAINVEAGA